MPKILNLKTADPWETLEAVYIGRPSRWGNPFVIGKDGAREEILIKYEQWALKKKLNERARKELKGKSLCCFCTPEPCHGDFLLKWANET